ncbi:MAG: hypothetical protein JWN00_3835 [Actinomycetia bacterium]|jgi:hypothetical protein|nr:hypothetical protein [Actinomycetes bacterium]
MPCFRCGARQSDPVQGASPWRRGVRADRQVLICPVCQRGDEWPAELDRCEKCGSVALVCRLGEVECRDCGNLRIALRPAADGQGAETPGLSEEVAAALSRVLRRAH